MVCRRRACRDAVMFLFLCLSIYLSIYVSVYVSILSVSTLSCLMYVYISRGIVAWLGLVNLCYKVGRTSDGVRPHM